MDNVNMINATAAETDCHIYKVFNKLQYLNLNLFKARVDDVKMRLHVLTRCLVMCYMHQ